MKIIELNAGTLNPADSERSWGQPHAVCRCLAVDLGERLILVDTGIGLADIAAPDERLGAEWLALARPSLDETETVRHQLGEDAARVTDIVLTHQHRDHAGGLADFPDARVHALPAAREAVEGGVGPDKERGRPAQWAHGVRWADAPTPAGQWRGLATWALAGFDERIRLVELPGHCVGHAGVLIDAGNGYLLHVGDAAFHPSQYLGGEVPPGVAAFTRAMQYDEGARLATEAGLTRVAAMGDVRIVTAHAHAG